MVLIKMKPKAELKRLFPDNISVSQDMKDQELDRLMRQIAEDASLGDVSVEEIADSPALWWSVQREIRGTSPAKSPWPPNLLRRWLIVGLPVAAAIVVGVGLYVGSSKVGTPEVAHVPSSNDRSSAAIEPERKLTEGPKRVEAPEPSPARSQDTTKSDVGPRRAVVRAIHVALPRKQIARAIPPKTPTEIRSDFIALAYARDPESGQIIRVKVPSSMMVQLGVVGTVEKPSALVDAEVLVGDDGLTRAIRFIRQ